MRLYLDDIRECPKGWILARTYAECIRLIDTEQVEEMSLDHDLGEEKTGYDILRYILDKVVDCKEYEPPARIHLHTGNPVGRQRMLGLVESISFYCEMRD
jgi:hypothetical protein